MRRYLPWSAIPGLFAAPMIHAAESGVTETARMAPDPMSVTGLLQVTLGLLVVLAAVVGGAWLLRRIGRFQTVADGSLKIIGGLSMGTRERLVLVQVGDEQLLVGVSPGRLQTLHVLKQPIPMTPASTQPEKGFAERLAGFLGQRSQP